MRLCHKLLKRLHHEWLEIHHREKDQDEDVRVDGTPKENHPLLKRICFCHRQCLLGRANRDRADRIACLTVTSKEEPSLDMHIA